jgi:ATP-grasp domain, R2K clade family 3
MPTPLWIVDAAMEERMAERSCGRAALSHAALAAGHRVALARWIEGTLVWEAGTAPDVGPAIVHGSFPFVDAANRLGFGMDLLAFDDARFTATDQRRWLGTKLLNADAEDTVLAAVPLVVHGDVFLRPVDARLPNHTKAFPGQVLKTGQAFDFVRALLVKGVPSDLPVSTAPLKDIHAEARHLIVGGRVVASSIYRFQGALHVRIDSYPAQRALARAVARKANQPAFAYTCDTAVVDGPGGRTVKVVELNFFSSSGLYGMDRDAIVAAFGRALA